MGNDERCAICGHVISLEASIKRGIGSECYSAYLLASYKAIMSDSDNSLKYNWLIKVEVFLPAFIEMFKNTKFRSDFKKSFYTSICKSTRISKKQFEIMYSWICEKDCETADKLDDLVIYTKKQFLEEKRENLKLTTGLIEAARIEIRKNNL